MYNIHFDEENGERQGYISNSKLNDENVWLPDPIWDYSSEEKRVTEWVLLYAALAMAKQYQHLKLILIAPTRGIDPRD